MQKPYGISILSYNHPDLTAKCLRSVLQHSAPENVFLTHNGSLQHHREKLVLEFSQIQHIFVEENHGYSAGANHALKAAFEKFETVLFLTNDTELIQLPKTAPKNFNSIQLLRRNSQEIDSVMGALNPKTGRLKHLKKMNDLRRSEISYIPGTAFWIDRNSFNTLKGFDERFHTYWEDVDFSLRAHKAQISLGYDSETICRHKIGKTCHKDRFYTFELFQRNRGRCLTKHKMTSLRFYWNYIPDVIRYSRADYKKALSILKAHRLKELNS